MDYSSYFAPPAPAYPFFSLPGKPEHYTPQDETHNDPLVSILICNLSNMRRHDSYLPYTQEAYNDPNAFQFFDQTAHFNPPPITLPPQSPPVSIHRPSISNVLPYDSSGSASHEVLPDVEFDQAPGGRGSSDGDDDKDNLTPAQSRRKAQNRAA